MSKKILQFILSFSCYVLLLPSLTVKGQDPHFTQFYANPLYLNPAFAGSAHCPRINLNYRNQWPALQGQFITASFSYDQQIPSISSGIGLLALTDNAGEGTLNTTNLSGIYAYQVNITREFSIRFGVKATYWQRKLDWSKLTFGDMIDPRYGFIYPTSEVQPASTTKSFVDFSAGVLAYSNNIYGGVAVDHLTQPEESFIRPADGSTLPMKITTHVGAIVPLEGRNDGSAYISPNFIFQQQRKFQTLNIGVYVGKLPLVGGLWYRHAFGNPDAVVVLVGLQQGAFKVGYTYDVTISKLSNVSAGSHELSLGIQFPCHPKKKRFRTIKCPSF
jgi:type IX secretion system PorP/SprF family membrane protein